MRIAVLGIIILAFFSCDKDAGNTGNKLELLFELKYDGEVLKGPEQLYELNDSVEMRFSKVGLYLSGFQLNGPEPLPLLDIVHISFLQNISGDAILEMQQSLKFEVPSGDYSSLSFGLGLTPYQNAKIPADYEAGSALSLASEYWPAWESYIFEKIEGTFKVHGGAEVPVALHVGGNPTYRILEWNDGLVFPDGKEKKITIPIDLKYILEDYPVTKVPKLHSLEQLPYMEMIADGFSQSMEN